MKKQTKKPTNKWQLTPAQKAERERILRDDYAGRALRALKELNVLHHKRFRKAQNL